ncbi:MAG: hypothetical protein DRH70_08835 [Candidatus Coatesbacteria bacterium]|nr:MAG: hypothetical protein DRH70_08835 [Candidatus Coatesbacteria bacterium]
MSQDGQTRSSCELNSGRAYILVTPYLVVFPGITVVLVVLSLNFLGDSLRDVLDPRQILR